MAAAEALSADDARSFTLRLREPFAQVLEAFAKPSSLPCFMMPERLAALDPATAIPEAMGSGPYRMLRDEWDPGNKVVFARNAAYRPRSEPASFCAGGKVTHFDRIEWISIPDAATATAALTRGEVDWYDCLPSTCCLPSRGRGGLGCAGGPARQPGAHAVQPARPARSTSSRRAKPSPPPSRRRIT